MRLCTLTNCNIMVAYYSTDMPIITLSPPRQNDAACLYGKQFYHIYRVRLKLLKTKTSNLIFFSQRKVNEQVINPFTSILKFTLSKPHSHHIIYSSFFCNETVFILSNGVHMLKFLDLLPPRPTMLTSLVSDVYQQWSYYKDHSDINTEDFDLC